MFLFKHTKATTNPRTRTEMILIGVAVATSIYLTSCGRNVESQSTLEYKLADKAYAGLLRKVHNPSIKICMASDANSMKHRDDVAHAIEEWTSALIGYAPTPVTKKVEFLAPNDPTCDATVFVGNYSPAYTNLGNTPSVHINYSGWFGSRTVTLHEFGHAFGLLDTYAGSGGSCQSGQPSSVMCNANFDHLQTDDTAGLRKAYDHIKARNFAADDDRIPVSLQ